MIKMNSMIVKINGNPINGISPVKLSEIIEEIPKLSNKERKQMRKLAVLLWGVSGSFFAKSRAFAEGTDRIWIQMQPIWTVFQDIAMTIGAIALFIGLISFVFKRQLGKKIIVTTAIAIGGCFLVPATLMLISIIGSMINSVLLDVFQNSGLKDSVKVGG